MSWFAVPVVFSIEAPTEEAAALLAEDQHATELQELLDYPEVSVAALGEDVDEDADGGGFGRYLVAVTVTLEADDQRAARSTVERAVAEADAIRHDFREISEPSPTSDPRQLSEETKRAIDYAKDLLGDELRMDAESLRSGAKFEDLLRLADVLPGCFASHYTAELVERFSELVGRVASKLASYPDTYLASTAEELVAHAIIEEAGAVTELRDDRFSEDEAGTIARELDDLHEDAFEDHDVLMLFDARFDGIESGEIADQMGMANSTCATGSAPFAPDGRRRQEATAPGRTAGRAPAHRHRGPSRARQRLGPADVAAPRAQAAARVPAHRPRDLPADGRRGQRAYAPSREQARSGSLRGFARASGRGSRRALPEPPRQPAVRESIGTVAS